MEQGRATNEATTPSSTTYPTTTPTLPPNSTSTLRTDNELHLQASSEPLPLSEVDPRQQQQLEVKQLALDIIYEALVKAEDKLTERHTIDGMRNERGDGGGADGYTGEEDETVDSNERRIVEVMASAKKTKVRELCLQTHQANNTFSNHSTTPPSPSLRSRHLHP